MWWFIQLIALPAQLKLEEKYIVKLINSTYRPPLMSSLCRNWTVKLQAAHSRSDCSNAFKTFINRSSRKRRKIRMALPKLEPPVWSLISWEWVDPKNRGFGDRLVTFLGVPHAKQNDINEKQVCQNEHSQLGELHTCTYPCSASPMISLFPTAPGHRPAHPWPGTNRAPASLKWLHSDKHITCQWMAWPLWRPFTPYKEVVVHFHVMHSSEWSLLLFSPKEAGRIHWSMTPTLEQ